MWIIPNHLSHKSIICIEGEEYSIWVLFCPQPQCYSPPSWTKWNFYNGLWQYFRAIQKYIQTRVCAHTKGNIITIRNAKLWIFTADVKTVTKFSANAALLCSDVLYRNPQHTIVLESFIPLNIHCTLLSPWTSPSLCWSSLISSPRCLFRSWESLNSCARLAWKYQDIVKYDQKQKSG